MARINVSNLGHSAAPSDPIPRPRLLELLRGCMRQTLWLTGPSGSGKSVLARDYCVSSDQMVIWYRFDGSNGSLRSFLEQIAEEVCDCHSQSSEKFPVLSECSASGSKALFTAIANLHGVPWILCLDDYHLLDEKSELHDILADLAVNAKNLYLKVIVTSRMAPPAQWSPAIVNRQVEVFADFNFDLEELSRIAATYSEFAGVTGQRLGEWHQYTEGWPAGIILLLERLRLGFDGGLSLKDVGRKATSDFFSNNILSTLPEGTRQILVRSSLLPFLPVGQTEAILDIPSSKPVLDQLCHDRMFTFLELRGSVPDGDEEASYLVFRHQSLFREFLRQQADLYLSREERMSVALRGATVLAQSNEVAAAVDVYIEYAAWDEVAALILSSSLQLIQSGQISNLYETFSRLPAGFVDSDPNLLFWRGVCETSLGLPEARDHLSRAYSMYRDQDNVIGMAIAWRAVVDAIWLSWEGLDELPLWIAEYDVRAAQEYQALPEPFQVGLMMSRFGVLSFWSPEHPELKQLEQGVAGHVHTPMPIQERALLFVKILYHFTYGTGDRSQTDFYLNVMRTLVQQSTANPLDRILLENFEAAYQYCFVGSPDKCYEHVEEALKVGDESGISVWQSVSLTHGLYMALGQGDMSRAKRYLANFKQVIGLNNSMHVAFDELFSGWFAMLNGRYSSAMRHVDAGLVMLDRKPVPMIRNLFLGGRAALLIQRRDWKEAWLVLSEIRRFARAARSNTLEIMVRLLQANCCLNRGRNWAARAFLQRARDIGLEQNILVCPWLAPDQLPGLIAFAIESDIDQAYFSRWVSLYALEVPTGYTARNRWPWRVRIRTLGTFEIRQDDQMLDSQRRAHKRLLEILGVLITAGPRGVSQSGLIGELWPDKSEEKGRSNLNTNLARLRAFLCESEAVISSEGRVYLNAEICWVDSWELLGTAKDKGPLDVSQLTVLEELYRGAYAVPETDGGAEVMKSRSLANRYLRVARPLAEALRTEADFDRAIAVYRNMLEKLGPDEAIYCDLMACFAQMNRPKSVSATYRECEKVLADRYDSSPSSDTRSCYQKLVSDAG